MCIRPGNKVLGNAHFASGLEVYRAEFFKREEQSIIIGKKAGVPIYANGFEHVLVFATTGSGKIRSIGIPIRNIGLSLCIFYRFKLFCTRF